MTTLINRVKRGKTFNHNKIKKWMKKGQSSRVTKIAKSGGSGKWFRKMKQGDWLVKHSPAPWDERLREYGAKNIQCMVNGRLTIKINTHSHQISLIVAFLAQRQTIDSTPLTSHLHNPTLFGVTFIQATYRSCIANPLILWRSFQ